MKQKVAVLYSGSIRTLPELFENHKRHLLDLYDCDVYMSLWDTWVPFVTTVDGVVHSDSQVSHKTFDRIREELNPVILDIEHITDLRDTFTFYRDVWALRNSIPPRILNYVSMHYKMQRCFNLAVKLIASDRICVRMRCDIKFKQDVIFEDIAPNTIYTSDLQAHTQNGWGVCDQIAYGDREAIGQYSSIWDNWMNLAPRQGLLFNPEVVLLNHLKMRGVQIAARSYIGSQFELDRGDSNHINDKLRMMFFTNENNIPIMKLAIKYWLKHNEHVQMRDLIYVVSNKLNTQDLPRPDKVEYFSANIPYCPASTHFGPTLKQALDRVRQEFVMFFCDDYIMTDSIDVPVLNNILKMMIYDNIDMFSFAWTYPQQFGFEQYTPQQDYGFEPDAFFVVKPGYRHRYSVQPCIWRRSTLLKILEKNPYLTVHALDNSSIAGQDGSYRTLDPVTNEYTPWLWDNAGYNDKVICTKYRLFTLDHPSEKFGIAYHEVTRHGAFHVSSNGFDTDKYPANKFLLDMIETEQLRSNPEYAKYFIK